MQRTVPRALAAIAALGIIALAAWWLRDRGEPSVAVNPSTPSPAPLPHARPASITAPSEPASAAKLRELQAMSETYRNTTFLIAIRDAGFVCHELLDVHGGVDASLAWTAACSDMLAYTVRVADSGALGVEPLARYIDGLVPLIEQRTEPTPTVPPRGLPEPLR
jgi:hypothetical protein